MNEKQSGYCKYSSNLLCNDTAACNSCGWNPRIHAERVSRILNVHPEFGSDELLRCPFCGARPKVTHNGTYESITCGNQMCGMASTGFCASHRIAVSKWNSRAPVYGNGGQV